LIEAHLETDSLGDATKTDLIGKHFEAVKFELEAVLRLGQWDEIDNLFQVRLFFAACILGLLTMPGVLEIRRLKALADYGRFGVCYE
jgi:hypothetical protein